MKKKIKQIIVLGPDACGKTTALLEINKYLESKGKVLHKTRALGGDQSDFFQIKIRNMLLDPQFPSDNLELEQSLFALASLECSKKALQFIKDNPVDGFVTQDRGIGCHFAYSAAMGYSVHQFNSTYSKVISLAEHMGHEIGVLHLVLVPDKLEYLQNRLKSRSHNDGTAIIDRLENNVIQEKVTYNYRNLQSIMSLRNLDIQIVQLTESDTIQDVTKKILNLLSNYDI